MDVRKLISDARNSLINSKDYFGNPLTMARSNRDNLDISVSYKNIEPAIQFYEILLTELQKKQFDIQVIDKYTYITLAPHRFIWFDLKINLREITKRVADPIHKSTNNSEPTGVLCFKMYNYIQLKEWNNKKTKLADQIPEIVGILEKEGGNISQQKIEWAKRDKEQETLKQIEAQRKVLVEKELSDFKLLLQKAQQWDQSVALRKYLKEIRVRAITNNCMTEELTNWLSWANKKADWYDPLINKRDELLTDKDRYSLHFN